MNSKVNKENYELVFFNLLEGEYSTSEKEEILAEIKKDTFLSFEWENWQKSVLDDSQLPLEEDTLLIANMKQEISLLDEKKDKKVVPIFWWGAGLAAGLALLFIVGSTMSSTSQVEEIPIANENKSKEIISHKIPLDNITLLDDVVAQESKEVNREEEPRFVANKIVKQPVQDNPLVLDETVEDFILEEDTIFSTQEAIVAKENPLRPDEQDKQKKLIAEIPVEKPIAQSSPSRKLKFSVTTAEITTPVDVVDYSYLEENQINLQDLIADRKVTIVRHKEELCIKLIEEDKPAVYIALR